MLNKVQNYEEYGKRGLGSESTKLINKYGLEELGLKRIYLRVLKENSVARRAYEKAGYSLDEHTEIITINGIDKEVVFMSIYGQGDCQINEDIICCSML